MKRRLLIVGCGDIARRTLPQLARHWRIYVLMRERDPSLKGVTQVIGDLDHLKTLRRLTGLAHAVLYTAPPSTATNDDDPRIRRFMAVLRRGRLPQSLVYIGTTGVYGDCGGQWVTETRPIAPLTNRAQRRVAAEIALRHFGTTGCRVSLLRVPGIYAANRLPLERIRQGWPVVTEVFTNHIHADDLALACAAALLRGRPNRIYNICDDSEWTVEEWFNRLAQTFHLPLPPSVSRREAQRILSPMQFSFMNESRRIDNRRMKKELGVKLNHPVINMETLTRMVTKPTPVT
ncbi:MAG: SDR family NAD(P)-dependent oxidoreductase [Rhodocyclaceae bacterium]|nr:SDR family NAD(P)-dependent oxidoreductase [Rhodocyclaceae bacterium]